MKIATHLCDVCNCYTCYCCAILFYFMYVIFIFSLLVYHQKTKSAMKWYFQLFFYVILGKITLTKKKWGEVRANVKYYFLAAFFYRNFIEITVNKAHKMYTTTLTWMAEKYKKKQFRVFNQKINVETSWLITKSENITVLLLLLLLLIDLSM